MKKRFPRQEKQITEGVMIEDREPLATWARESNPGDLSGNRDKRSIEQLLSVNTRTPKNEEHNQLLEY